MRVRVVREGCIGCGQCAEICPQVFCLASDGLARVERLSGEVLRLFTVAVFYLCKKNKKRYCVLPVVCITIELSSMRNLGLKIDN